MKYKAVWHDLKIEDEGDGTALVTREYSDDCWRMDLDVAERLPLLDGTVPMKQVFPGRRAGELRALREEFEEAGLFRSRILYNDLSSTLICLWYGTEENRKQFRGIGTLVSRLLDLLWFPTVLLGFGALYFGWDRVCCHAVFTESPAVTVLSYIMGIGGAIFLHEFSHMCAGARYGAVTEAMGVGRSCFVLPIGFVLMDTDKLRSRWRRAKIDLAGVQMNLFLAGMSALLIALCPVLMEILLPAVTVNGMTALGNCFLGLGFDGQHCLYRLLGIPLDTGLLELRSCFRSGRGLGARQRAVSGLACMALDLTLLIQLAGIGILLTEGLALKELFSDLITWLGGLL